MKFLLKLFKKNSNKCPHCGGTDRTKVFTPEYGYSWYCPDCGRYGS